ncbi:hypothetical protein EXS72_01920 [Candidatus Pacearchaeota archaeon]|nr:hypothetical protein [Candidatus Pacearchaeota archaeon]
MDVYSQTNYSKEKILAKSENELKLSPITLNISAPALTPPTLPFSLPLNHSLAFRTVPSPSVIVVSPCLTPNVIPITITSSITLCGNMLEEENRNNFREILKDRAYLKRIIAESQK